MDLPTVDDDATVTAIWRAGEAFSRFLDAEFNTDQVLSYWTCDACQRKIPARTNRWNCTVCGNFDYCDKCYGAKGGTHGGHKMVPEQAFGPPAFAAVRKGNMCQTVLAMFEAYSYRWCLGTRRREADGRLTDLYDWLTYAQVGERVKNTASGLASLDVAPRSFAAISGANGPAWVVADFACIVCGLVGVPVHTQFDDDECAHVLNNTPAVVLFCDRKLLGKFLRIQPRCPSLRYIVCLDGIPTVPIGTTGDGPRLMSMTELQSIGAARRTQRGGDGAADDDYVVTAPDDCLTVVYTSGSTGFPKGVMISERFCYVDTKPVPDIERVRISYRPLAHATDRTLTHLCCIAGGRTAFHSGDFDRLFEEIALIRPSEFGGPPRVWAALYSEFRAALARATDGKPDEAREAIEKRVLSQFSTMIPKRCAFITIGGAYVPAELVAFMRRCFPHCRVTDSFGSTECGQIASNGRLCWNVEARLEPVPELGYSPNDKPYPRGELCVKTKTIMMSYANDPLTTRQSMTDDGYFRTGDIVELRADRGINVIDRRKNFFKLAQGEYVSPERLQEVYARSPFVDQVYVDGRLDCDCVLAVVVPNRPFTLDWASRTGTLPEASEHVVGGDEEAARLNRLLAESQQFHAAILRDIRGLAREAGRAGQEVPPLLIVDFEPFSSANGRLTPSLKPCRHAIARHYAARLDALYEQLKRLRDEVAVSSSIDDAEPTTAEAMRQDDDDVQNRLASIVAGLTGLRPSSSSSAASYGSDTLASLGGDSLSAVRLSRRVRQAFGVHLPASTMLRDDVSIDRLAEHVRSELRLRQAGRAKDNVAPAQGPCFETSGSDGAFRAEGTLHSAAALRSAGALSSLESETAAATAGLLDSDSLLDPSICKGLPPLNVRQPADVEWVFLTGATGFFGVFLLRELLRVYANCRVACLVRASSSDEARRRLEANWRHMFRDEELDAARIVPMCGDLAEPRLGLADVDYDLLLDKAEFVVHCGAVVNAVLPYERLRAANVCGTIEVLRLACHGRRLLPVHFVSSVSALPPGVRGSDDVDIETVSHRGLTRGYGQSKWVAERLMRAAIRAGVPVTIYRPGTIGPDSSTGACNGVDFYTRLLACVMQLGTYPDENAEMEMVPVDFAARAVVWLTTQPAVCGKTFNVVHPDPPPKFSQCMRWIAAGGSSIMPLPYRRWLRALEAAVSDEASVGRSNSLEPLLPYFDGERFPMGGHFECPNLLAALQPANFTCPDVDEQYVQKWATFVALSTVPQLAN